MDYTPEGIDIPAFEDGLMQKREYQKWKRAIAVEKADAYFSGYDQALFDVQGMLHCSNYEKRAQNDIVRCHECKHWFENGSDLASCDCDALLRHKDFFCANGERRKEE